MLSHTPQQQSHKFRMGVDELIIFSKLAQFENNYVKDTVRDVAEKSLTNVKKKLKINCYRFERASKI